MFPNPTPSLLDRSAITFGALLAMGSANGDLGWEASALVTWQSASDARIHDEVQGSADLMFERLFGPGALSAHIEASSTPKSAGVSGLIGEANGDAGSALDSDGDGRVQLSELTYTLQAGPGELSLGLIDTTDPLDNSNVANDADTQFLGTGLNNNPTIEFPDYTLGAFYQLPINGQGGTLALLAAGSQGLGESTDAGYGELFDLGEDGRGAFLAAEWQQIHDWGVTRLGTWTHTADHAAISGAAGDLHNYGIYASIDAYLAAANVNLRVGAAREAVSEAARFASIASELPVADRLHLGAGAAWTGASNELADAADTLQGELYLRWQPTSRLHVSPSIQYIRNSSFDGSGANVDADVWVAGLRAGYHF